MNSRKAKTQKSQKPKLGSAGAMPTLKVGMLRPQDHMPTFGVGMTPDEINNWNLVTPNS